MATKEKEMSTGERLAAMLTKRDLPDLSIELGRIYEYDVVDGHPAMRQRVPITDCSYVGSGLSMLTDIAVGLYLSTKQVIDLPPGVTIVLGRTGSGKTRLTFDRLVNNNDGVAYARFGEPLDVPFVRALVAETPGVNLVEFESELAWRIADFLVTDAFEAMVVDSLRYQVYAGGGSTGKGGVNMTLFTRLSFLDTVVARRGKSLIVIINPMADEAAAYAQIAEVAAGSVSALIDVISPTSVRLNSRYNNRRWESINLPHNPVPTTGERDEKVKFAGSNLSSVTK